MFIWNCDSIRSNHASIWANARKGSGMRRRERASLAGASIKAERRESLLIKKRIMSSVWSEALRQATKAVVARTSSHGHRRIRPNSTTTKQRRLTNPTDRPDWRKPKQNPRNESFKPIFVTERFALLPHAFHLSTTRVGGSSSSKSTSQREEKCGVSREEEGQGQSISTLSVKMSALNSILFQRETKEAFCVMCDTRAVEGNVAALRECAHAVNYVCYPESQNRRRGRR